MPWYRSSGVAVCGGCPALFSSILSSPLAPCGVEQTFGPLDVLKSRRRLHLENTEELKSAFYCFCLAAVQGGTLGAFNWLQDVGSLFSSEAPAEL